MREGWTYKKLGEVITPAKLVKNSKNDNLPILSITMHDGIILQSSRFKKVIASIDTSTYKIVKRGQLVIAFPIDEGLIYTQDIVDAGIMSPAYNVWDVDFSELNNIYLIKYLHSPFAMNYYKSKLRGTTMRRRSMPKADLLNMPLLCPPLSEQEAIVSELDKINELISLKKAQLSDLDNLAQSIFYEMFGDPVENEKGWEVKKLGEVCLLKAGKSIKASELKEISDGLYPCYGGNGIRGYIEKVSHKKNLPIIGRQGALCGNVNFAKAPFYATEHAVVVTPNIELDVLWLYFELKGLRLEQYAHGVAQPGIAVSDLNPILLSLPPLSLQQSFATKIEAIEAQKGQVSATIKDLETLLASRMQYWFE